MVFELLVNPGLFITKMWTDVGRALKHVALSFPFVSKEASLLMNPEGPWLLGTGLV